MIVGCKKYIISYKTTNGIFAFQKHIESVHQQMWNEWMNKRKMGVRNEGDKWPTNVLPSSLIDSNVSLE
jgi:hypothetical protein